MSLQEKNYDYQVGILFYAPKSMKDSVKAAAYSQGMNVSEYLRNLIKKDMENNNE